MQCPVFPAASDAVQVTVVGGPTEKNEPEAGEQVGPEVTLTLSPVACNVKCYMMLQMDSDEVETVYVRWYSLWLAEFRLVYVTVTVKSCSVLCFLPRQTQYKLP